MPDGTKSKSPLLKSLSSKDLLRRSAHRNGFLTVDNSAAHEKDDANEAAHEAEEHLLQDLDNILNKKLHLGESSPSSSSLRGSPISLSPPRSPGERADNEAQSNGLDPDAQQEEEDGEEFANVDEIDGPISPSSSTGSLRDLARSHLHKTVDDSLGHDIDYNLPVDKDYQNQLDRRAEELGNDLCIHQPSKATLQWSMQDFYSLHEELPDWFSHADYRYLGSFKMSFEKRYDAAKFLKDSAYAEDIVCQLIQRAATNPSETRTFQSLAYVSMGLYGDQESNQNHISSIRYANTLLMPFMSTIIESFIIHASLCRDSQDHLRHHTDLLLLSSSILFFVVNVTIEGRENRILESATEAVIQEISRANLLEFTVKYIEHWRWCSRLSMRIRNVIILLHRLSLLQFGDMKRYNKVKKYVRRKHNCNNESNRPNKLAISPLDYHAFREDISARFPTFLPPPSDIPASFDNSNSLSQFLEIPRPKSKSTLNLNTEPPEYHIATPMPSPSSSPAQRERGYPKSRKSFQTNLAYPSMYPSEADDSSDDVLSERLLLPEDAKAVEDVPYSVVEATRILHDSMEIKLSTKQLWHERELFMAQERGWGSQEEAVDTKLYYYDQGSSAEAQTMCRVEDFYEKCLPSFSSLVYVLLQTVETNVHNRVYFREDLIGDDAELKASSQLEITRAKEVALKSATSILFLMTKWFKLSHILKFEHLCVILHDYKLIGTATNLLNSFADRYPERALGKVVQTKNTFWKVCSTFNTQYADDYQTNSTACSDKNVDLRFLNTEVCVLTLLSQVTGSKTQRLKELPLSIGSLLKKLYQLFNLEIFHPILKITHELTPFKNKKWKAEHMDLISGVYLYKKLKLNDNWVTGKDIAGELNDACGQEIALRALLQFYNFMHYKQSVEHLGYSDKKDCSFFSKEAEALTAAR
ncbi:LAME_0H05666g1_1 [Lachancea meyersii CBS 8951]|uniref:LAME_0H05666g1_1 n=1 Tax=Lachancea meyersii CBS 8951 TaxID=1266667 RepID=A0A1G4KE84_9SACH|nr:LAME_0H05666g1_1 [Lachancea meyersii CBS 8951]